MSEDWFVNNEIPLLTSSRIVANVFKKEHKYVLSRIRAAQKLAEAIGEKKMFVKTTYKNKNNQNQPEFLMTRDGFVLIAMGFTGKDAFTWKIKFIEAFNSMEQKLIELEENKKIAKNKLSLNHSKWVQGVFDFPETDDGRPLRLVEENITKQLKRGCTKGCPAGTGYCNECGETR